MRLKSIGFDVLQRTVLHNSNEWAIISILRLYTFVLLRRDMDRS